MEKYNVWRSGYLSKFHEVLPLPRKVTLQLHQILRLPRKMNPMIDPRHTWNVIYNARSKHSQPLTLWTETIPYLPMLEEKLKIKKKSNQKNKLKQTQIEKPKKINK